MQSQTVIRRKLGAEESLLLYSDGLSEACNAKGEEYGIDRLRGHLLEMNSSGPKALVGRIVEDLNQFLAHASRTDDISIMAIQRLT